VTRGLLLSISYLLAVCAAIVVVLLTILFLGADRLRGSEAIVRDGLLRGTRAPSWTRRDAASREWTVPDGRWKFLLFADYSLSLFPEVGQKLVELAQRHPDVDVLVVSKTNPRATEVQLKQMGLTFPVIGVDHDFFSHYRVRVMPYATVVDPEGYIRFSRLVSTQDTVLMAWRVGTLPPLTDAEKSHPYRHGMAHV
jgi:hypothetical protein